MPKKMGKKTGYKRVQKKKIYRKKKAYGKASGRLGGGSISLKSWKSNDPFPPFCFKRMTYAFSAQLAYVTGGNALFGATTEPEFRLNSPQDCRVGATANTYNQAYGWSEMTALYNRYKANAVLVEIQFFDPSTDGLAVGVLINNPSNAGDTLLNETVGSVEKKPQGWTGTLSNTGSQKLIFRQFFNMNDLFNVSKLQFKADMENTTAGVTGNPGTMAYLKINVADTTARAAGSTLYMAYTIRLTYFTMFYQRKQY